MSALASLTDLPAGASPGARAIHDLFAGMNAAAWVLSAAAIVPLVVLALRYRWKPEPPAPPRLSRQARLGLQATWVVVPMAILLGLGVWSQLVLEEVGAPRDPGADATALRVVAHQWIWEFQYPDNTSSLTSVDLEAGREVNLQVTSADVVHSFYVPDLALRVDAVPGRINEVRFLPDTPGTYEGHCGQFCGIGHAQMPLRVVVFPAGSQPKPWGPPPAGNATGNATAGAGP